MKIIRYIGKGFILIDELLQDRKAFRDRWGKFCQNKNRKKIIEKYGKETIYYIWRFDTATFGIATTIRSVLSNLKYALDNGWTLVVDMENVKSPYLYEDEVGKKNAWEYYFKQPGGYI